MIIYRYGINSKSDSGDRYYRNKSCRACCCDLYPQPVWVVWESGINNALILNLFLRRIPAKSLSLPGSAAMCLLTLPLQHQPAAASPTPAFFPPYNNLPATPEADNALIRIIPGPGRKNNEPSPPRSCRDPDPVQDSAC